MFLIFNDVSKPEERISTVEILRVGKWFYGGREIEFTEDDLKHIVENYKNGIRPKHPTELVVDYNHGSMDTEPEKSKAAGWVKDLFYENGSLYAKIKWTERAKNYIMGDEFRYTSAEIDPAYTDKETGENRGMTLLAIALTNRPFIEGQESISLAEKRDDLRKAAEARAKKYGIHVRKDGHLTKPSEYKDVPDDKFADPVNYRYPLVPEERAIAAYKYFSKKENKAFYSPEEQKKIEARIKAALPKKMRANAFEEERMEENKEILSLKEEIKNKEQELIKLREENEKLKKDLLLSEANEWVMKQVNDKMILSKEIDLFTEMYIKDKELAKKFVESRGKVLPDGVTGQDVDESSANTTAALSEIDKIRNYAKEHNLTFAEARVEMLKEAK